MLFRVKPALLSALAASAMMGGTALAQSPSGEQAVKARHDLMEAMSKNNKTLAAAAKAGTVDAAAAKAAETISASMAKIPSLFPPGTGDDKLRTRAKAEIWQSRDKFEALAKEGQSAFAAVAAAAEAGNDAAFKASFAKAAQVCGTCHKVYRGPELK